MAETWERYERSQEMPDHCPLRKLNGDLCGKPSNDSPKVNPFCCWMHRDEHVRQQRREDEKKLVAGLAAVGDLVDNAGRVCRVKKVHTDEKENTRPRLKGHAYKSGNFETTWITHCDDRLSYTPPSKATVVTCLSCAAVERADHKGQP